jgi:hypothetical protein
VAGSENRHQTYNQSEAGKQRRKEYRERNRKQQNRNTYKQKPFISIGGIATKLDDGQTIYSHVQLSTGQQLTNLNGLTSNEIFSFIVSNTGKAGANILVCYAGTFDWNYWLQDLTHEQLIDLYDQNHKTKAVPAGLYRLRLMKGQALTIADIWGETRTINEVFNFFQVPLETAVKDYLGYEITGGSKWTKSPAPENLPQQITALSIELHAIVELMEDFRNRLDRVNLRPKRWSGAGSITSNLFQEHNVKSYMAEPPEDIAQKARYAYAGGRFEMVKYGSVSNKNSYGYDINSAYPEALAQLPSLAGGRWLSIGGDPGDVDYGLYKITIKGKNSKHPSPLFARDPNGAIFYPSHVTGWYWAPEIKAVRKWAEAGYGTYEIDQALLFEPATTHKPFAWITKLYEQRLLLQAMGDGAEVGLKLALNSAYGKLAQQVGWLADENGNPELIPPYHQLEWAGWVTSYTRAKVFEAALENLEAVIAFETDCLYMADELYSLPITDQLGAWKETTYTDLTYINSGIYYGTKKNGQRIIKMRGLIPGTVTPASLDKLLEEPERNRVVNLKQKRFVTAFMALHNKTLDYWLTWREEDLEIKLYPIGKRAHLFCGCQDYDTEPLTRNYWHQTITAKKYKQPVEYCVEWRNPEPTQIAERLKQRLNVESLL